MWLKRGFHFQSKILFSNRNFCKRDTSADCALTCKYKKDIDVAWCFEICQRKRIHRIILSDLLNAYKFNSTVKIIERAGSEAVKYARRSGDMELFMRRTPAVLDNEYLARVVEAVIKAGATVVNIPDTTGYCPALEYGENNIWCNMGRYWGKRSIILSSLQRFGAATWMSLNSLPVAPLMYLNGKTRNWRLSRYWTIQTNINTHINLSDEPMVSSDEYASAE